MPDPFQYALAVMVAFAVSLVAVAGTRGFSRWRVLRAVGITEVLAVLTGIVAGYRILEFEYVWPPANAISRFLTIILPAAIIVELISGLRPNSTQPEVRRFKNAGLLSILAMGLRVGLFASIGRTLLHNSVYLQVFPSVNVTWSEWQIFFLLTASAVLLTSVWLVLFSLAERDGAGSVTASLSLSIMTAGLVVMLAGYIKGGAAAFPVSASLMGVVVANAIIQRAFDVSHCRSSQSLIGPGVTALFSLLWIGSLFGELPASTAITIFLAPTFCWVSEVSVFGRLSSRRKALLRLIAVAIPLAIQLFVAKRTFDQKLGALLAGVTESLLDI